MEHSYFKDRISAFIDGELPPYEEKVVGEHLVDCNECQKIKAELEKIDSLVENYSGLNNDEYWEKSAQKIESDLGLSETSVTDIKPKKKSRYKGIGWKLATVAASVAVLTFIGLHEKDIFKKIDTTPPMQAPSVIIPPESMKQKDIDSEQTFNTKEVEPEKHKISDVASSEKDEEVKKYDNNNVNERNSSGIQEKGVVPLDTDELTEGVNIEMEPEVSKVDRTINLAGKRDKSKDLATSTQATIDNEKIDADSNTIKNRAPKLKIFPSATAPVTSNIAPESDDLYGKESKNIATVDSTQLLMENIHRRDSLLLLWEKMSEDDKKLRITNSLQKMKSIDIIEKQLLMSYYDVAVMAKDINKEEYDSAIEFLREYATDSHSRYPIDARNYLKRLDIIDY